MKIQYLIPALTCALTLAALGQEESNNARPAALPATTPAAKPEAPPAPPSALPVPPTPPAPSSGNAAVKPVAGSGMRGGGYGGGGGMGLAGSRYGGGGGGGGGMSSGVARSVNNYVLSSGGSVAPLIVRFSDADPAANAALEEDLNVMTHLIEKALERGAGDETRDVKMGIELLYSGSRSVRVLYLEGFGACWMIKANFPVLAPAAADSKAAQPSGDSEWDRAKRELYGQGGKPGLLAAPEHKFDPQQVEALKKALLQSLKNAAHIRELKPDDFIAITVFGPPLTGAQAKALGLNAVAGPNKPALFTERVQNIVREAQKTADEAREKALADAPSAAQTAANDAFKQLRQSQDQTKRQLEQAQHEMEQARTTLQRLDMEMSSAPAAGTVLTIRVKKADADAFAAGTLDFKAFQQKAEVHAYPGSGYGLTSLNSWAKERNVTSVQKF